jgi:predicted aspartyl protease
MPFQSNGAQGNLIIDTGSPRTVIFRASVKKFKLSETKTKTPVKGPFGVGREFAGLATINALTAGNYTLANVPVEIATERIEGGTGRGMTPDGLFGLRELVTRGAVLDLGEGVVYLRAARPSGDVGAQVRAILLNDGYAAVPLSIADFHLHALGSVNGIPCRFIVDTGAYLTSLDANFAAREKIRVTPTPLTLVGLGGSTSVGMGILASLKIGNYEFKRLSASIVRLNPSALPQTKPEVVGFFGVEYLGLNSAIFDSIGGTLYLRPRRN